MPIEILMPALSPTMEEGTLAKWHVNEGDKVEPGDIIAEIETDKATMEVESVDEGTIGKILVSDGTEGVKVNELIAVLLEEGEDASAVDNVKSDGTPKAPAAAAAPVQAATPAATPPIPQSNGASPAGARIKASPLAKRMASQAGLDLASIIGSGPAGRIVKADVETAKSTPAPQAKTPAAPAITPVPVGTGDYTEVPLNAMRKTIAQRLTVAKRDVPHYYLTIDCEIDKLMKARKELNANSPEGEGAFKISVNDFIIRACAQSLMLVPGVNSSWAEDKLLQHNHADIAMAVAIDGGLITPIIHAAETKGLAAISREAKDLATRAKNRKLMPEEYQGGSFSISNLGMMGIVNFTAVINPPHAAILAIGAGEQRPVVKDGALAIATVMTVTMSCDHRVVDGALGSQFLNHFKRFIEDPVTMLL